MLELYVDHEITAVAAGIGVASIAHATRPVVTAAGAGMIGQIDNVRIWDFAQKEFDTANADENGYVQQPNVSELNEMINGMMAARAYDANITVMNMTRTLFDSTMRLIA